MAPPPPLRARRYQRHGLFEVGLEAEEGAPVAAEVGMERFYFAAVGGEYLGFRAGKRQVEGQDATRRIAADPIRKVEAVLANDHHGAAQRAQVGADVERHADVAEGGEAEDGGEIDGGDRPVEAVEFRAGRGRQDESGGYHLGILAETAVEDTAGNGAEVMTRIPPLQSFSL
jgi:hypothetical protein